MIATIEKLLEYDTAGDPVTGLKWTHRTAERIAEELSGLGIDVSKTTVLRLLHEMGFSLRVNHKKLSSGSTAQRDEQFTYIARLRKRFVRRRDPIISVDTKKKELVGQFKNNGAAWHRDPVLVKDHDFRSEALGMANPYGIYDLQANRGGVFIGVSYDTPAFAVASIEKWWRYSGQRQYPRATRLLILADSGGSNGPRCRAWKFGIQEKLADRHGLSVTVSHYPSGASKWNPVEHRLFSEISKNWAGRPLDSYQTILNYCRTTSTSTGLLVKAYLDDRTYDKGVRISDCEMRELSLQPHKTLPNLNYTIPPR